MSAKFCLAYFAETVFIAFFDCTLMLHESQIVYIVYI